MAKRGRWTPPFGGGWVNRQDYDFVDDDIWGEPEEEKPMERMLASSMQPLEQLEATPDETGEQRFATTMEDLREQVFDSSPSADPNQQFGGALPGDEGGEKEDGGDETEGRDRQGGSGEGDDNGGDISDLTPFDDDQQTSTGDYDPGGMQSLIEALERSRSLQGFDMWGGAPEWGQGSTLSATDPSNIVGLANMSLGPMQKMQGLSPSLRTRLEKLGPITEMDVGNLNSDERGMLADTMSGSLNYMDKQKPGFFGKIGNTLKDLFGGYVGSPTLSNQQVMEKFNRVAQSGLGSGVMADPAFAASRLGDVHSDQYLQKWDDEREARRSPMSFGRIMRQQQQPIFLG